MRTVSEWIKTCATFDVTSIDAKNDTQAPDASQYDPRNPGHPFQDPQYLLPYNYNPFIPLQQDISNSIIIGMLLPDSTTSSNPSLSSSPDEVAMNGISSTLYTTQNFLPVIISTQTENHSEYYDSSTSWSQPSMAALDNTGDAIDYPSLLNMPNTLNESNNLSQSGQEMMANGIMSDDINERLFNYQLEQQLAPVTNCPSTPILASQAPLSCGGATDDLATNHMDVQDQFNAILYSWSQHLVNGNITPTRPNGSPTPALSDSINSPSPSAPSPSLSTSSYFSVNSTFTPSQSSPSSPYPSSPYPSPLPVSSFPNSPISGICDPIYPNNSDTNFGNNSNNNNNNNGSRISSSSSLYNFAPRSSSKLTRRISQSSGYDPLSCSGSSQRPKTRGSGLTRSLTCPTCKKQYANSSTLRRHTKIHDYAEVNRLKAELRALDSYTRFVNNNNHNNNKNNNINGDPSITGSDVNQQSLCSSVSFMSLRDEHQSQDGGSLSEASLYAPSSSSSNPSSSSSSNPSSSSSFSSLLLTKSGYNPAKDLSLRKPECVGCNKAFARRDVVILHIKNQKKKWDLLSAILPTLVGLQNDTPSAAVPTTTTAAAFNRSTIPSPSSCPSSSSSSTSTSTTSGHPSGLSLPRFKKAQRHRRSHPMRMVIKLWQSTLQRKGYAIATNRTPCKNNQYRIGREEIKAEEGTEEDEEEEVEEDDDDENGDGEDGYEEERGMRMEREIKAELERDEEWPDAETLANMDNQTKVKWMMESLEVPPCWRERKVRVFGSFGTLEQEVLQEDKKSYQ